MYLTMFKASEDAVNLLLQAQRECEEIYISSPEADIKVLDLGPPSPREKGFPWGKLSAAG